MLKENLKTVEEHVQEACKRAGRSREEVTLIAVSKTKPLEMLQEIYGEGVRDFGENKVQELCDKMEQLPSDIRWHMILVEVNIAGEETKFGTTAEDAMLLVEEISKLENVRIKGLMTIAPFVENPEDNRLYFRKIKQLSVDITNKNIDNVSMEILSMGMTGDYEVAIEEGATMVRVGTGIFGARNYKKSNESH